jgi:hypothetical protein
MNAVDIIRVPLGRPEFVDYSKVPLGTDIVYGTYSENINYHHITLEDGTPATMIYHWGEGFPGVRLGSYDEYKSHWDSDMSVLNKMQVKLGSLSDDVRLIRAQITMFRRCHYAFPDSIAWILENIGELRHVLSRPVGCALPWWPRTELEHVGKMIETQINLCRWLNGEEVDPGQPPESAEQLRQFYEWLGERTELKELYVERLLWLPNKLLFEIDKRIDELTGTMPDTDLIRKPRENKYGAVHDCWHLYFRVFEIYLRSVGGGSWRAGMPPEGESAKAIFAAKKSYLFALDFWLRGVPLEQAQEECPSESETITKTYALLKESNPTKRWLAGCLWKVLKSRESGVRSDEYDRHPEKVPSEWLRQ